MKKVLLFLFSSIFALTPLNIRANINDIDLNLNSSSVVLIEPNSKRIIYQENKDQRHYPASMTKMMGMYIVLNHIKLGKLKWDDVVETSEYAASMGGTQIYLEKGEKMIVEDLFKSVCINSANDAITALGEHIAGSTPSFVDMMNKCAKELKMNNTNFVNPTGFDDTNHYTTPYDMALIAIELVKFGEDLFRFTRLKEDYIRKDTSNPFWLVNTNKMLGHYDGMDGLKTGFTTKANYNLTSTALRNGVRLISVVMNASSIKERAKDTTDLLNYGFSKLKAMTLFNSNEVVTTIDFINSLKKDSQVVTRENVVVVILKDQDKKDLKVRVELFKVEAPILKDEEIGNLIISTSDNYTFTYKLYSKEEVLKATFYDYFISFVLKMFA